MSKQLTEKKRLGVMSIQTKIIMWSGISFFLSAAFIIGDAAFALRTEAVRAAEGKALDVAHTEAAEIRALKEPQRRETFTQSVIIENRRS
jgi:hypothetical protein